MKYDVNNIKIIVNKEIVDSIINYYNSSRKYETGGILLGKFNKTNKVMEIKEVYELKTSFFSKILYKRNAKRAQKIIDRRWHETNGLINYLGEWHTHPNMLPIPSNTDIKSLRDISEKVKEVLPGTILIIAGKSEKVNLIIQKGNIVKIQSLSK